MTEALAGPVLAYKPDFARAQQYWDAFWEQEVIDRPCAVVWADGDDPQPEAPRTVDVDADVDSVLDLHDRFLATHHFLGECMPGFRPGFGPDQFAGFLGAPLLMGESGDTSWSRKVVEDWATFLPLRVQEDGACWARMKAFHEAAAARCTGRCLLYNIDLHSNLDALEGLRGAERLLYDIMDTPDLVAEAMRQVRKLHRRVFDEFYHYGNKEELGTTSWLHLYSRGRYGVIQSDFICLLTPAMFRSFALPAIEEEAASLDRACFHLDGPGALVHLDDLLAVNEIHAVQWVPGAGNAPQHTWVDLLRRIQGAGKSVILYGTPDEIRAFHGELDPALLVYDVKATSRDEGERLLAWLKEHT
jgi:hypothetical protein